MSARMKKEKAAKRAKAVRPRGRTSKPDAPAGVAKISVSVPFDELEWAKEKAGREGSTVSAVIADALRERRQTEAWNEFMTWALDGRPLSPEEIAAAETELWG